MMKLFYSRILVSLLFVSFAFSSCKLNYKSTTCGFHMHNDVNIPDSSIYLNTYSLYAKPGKDAEEILVLNKGEYCFHYNHCQGTEPVKAKLELFHENSEKSICVLDFGLAKTENIIFTTPETGKYRLVVQAASKRQITFFLCFRKRFREN